MYNYYRLRKLQQAACNALEQAQLVQLGEGAAGSKETEMSNTASTDDRAETLEILEANRETLELVLRVMFHAE